MSLSARYRFWCWRKYWSEREIRLAAKLAKPGTLCLDIGANAGAYSYFMQSAGATVHAFEPIPELATRLRERFSSRLTVHQLGISDRAGQFEIKAPLINGQPAYGLASVEQRWPEDQSVTHKIETRTLDSFAFENVSLLKIDIEGHEAAALRGALETLARCRPALIIEAEDRHKPGAVAEVWSLLKPLGYGGSFSSNGQSCDITQFDVARHQRAFGDRDYVFNFVFQAL